MAAAHKNVVNQGSALLKEGGVVLLLTFPASLLCLLPAFLVLHLEAIGSLCELMQFSNSAKPGEFSMELGKQGGRQGTECQSLLRKVGGIAGSRVKGRRRQVSSASS